MTPDFLAALPDRIAARIHERLPGLRQCAGMAGRYDLAELQSVSTRAPAVLVARLGAVAVRALSGPRHHYALRMAAYVITKDELELKRDKAAAAICQALLQRVAGAAWGIEGLGAATDVADQSLSGAGAKAKGVALWAVTWTQPAVLEPLPAQVTVPIELYVSQAPAIGAAHQDDYERIGGEA